MTMYCVVYQTGGRDNYQWHRSLAMSLEDAKKSRLEVITGGRPAKVENYLLSLSVGLPEEYEEVTA